MNENGHALLGSQSHPLNFLIATTHMIHQMEGFLTLRTMVVIILTSDLDLQVEVQGQVKFMTLLYVFWDGDHENQYYFDL